MIKTWKWLKLFNSVPFIKKTLVNHVYIGIRSFWLTLTVLQWIKRNSKISQFSSLLLSSGYAIYVKIWQWLKFLNSFPFIQTTLVNHVYIGIWSSWLTFKALQWMKKTSKLVNLKISAKVPVCVLVKIWKWLKVLKFVPFIKKTLVNQLYICIWSFRLTITALQWMETNFKISQFEDFC